MYPYVRPNPLQEVLDAVSAGQELPSGGGGYGAPGGMLSPASSADPMASVLARLARPEPTPEVPQATQPSKKLRALAAITDAIQAWSALTMGQAPNPTATSGLYRGAEREAQNKESVRYAKARAAAEADKQSAMLEYQQLQQKHQEAVKEAEQAAARAEKLRQDKVESSRFIAEQESINARQKAQFEHDTEMAQLRGDIKIKENQAKPVKGKEPKSPTDVAKQRKKAEEVMKFLAEAKSGIAQQVASGLATDDIRRRLQAEMDARNLDGEDRQMVINFFAKHIQPILKAQDDKARIGG